MPLALAGRVPVKVNLDGGAIKPGDKITISSEPGIGTRATTTGMTIGVALESFDGLSATGSSTKGIIQVFVNLGYAKLDDKIAGGKVASSTFADAKTGKLLTLGESLDMDNNDIINVRGIIAANDSWSIDENGNLKAVTIEAEKVKTGELEIGSSARPFGATLYDVENGQPYCLFIKGGEPQTVSGTCQANNNLFTAEESEPEPVPVEIEEESVVVEESPSETSEQEPIPAEEEPPPTETPIVSEEPPPETTSEQSIQEPEPVTIEEAPAIAEEPLEEPSPQEPEPMPAEESPPAEEPVDIEEPPPDTT